MPRILYFVNIPRFFVSHRLPLALAAQEAGYDVHVATSDVDTENIAHIHEAGLNFYPLPLAQHGTNPLQEIKTLITMIRLYRQLQPDIVHHVTIKPIIYGGIAARITGIAAVVGAMSGLGRGFVDDSFKMRALRQISNPLLKLALSHPNTTLIFQNPDDRQRFIDLKLLRPENTVLIRGSGVDMNVFTASEEIESTKPMILFAGRLMWQKGLGEFVEAARRLKDKARFVVVGYAEATSPDAVSQTEIEQWEKENLIEYWGKRDDMPQVFAQSHIVCLPSSYGEGVPKVLIEAAASARPIVTTDTPGCREITHHGENGLLVAPHDIDALTQALETLIEDSDLRQRMGKKGREIAEQDFSLQAVLAETLGVYKNLLK